MIEGFTIMLVNRVVEAALSSLTRRHGVESIPYVLSPEVRDQFRKSIEVATKALLACIERRLAGETPYRVPFDDSRDLLTGISQAVTSPEVAEEISNLLDPGLEVFDRFKLNETLSRALPSVFPLQVREEIVEEAWEEFLRAFSFASRSLPHLREFLRASYEAGTFRKISDIAGAVHSLESGIAEFSAQESSLQSSMAAYAAELQSYRDWAA